METPPVSNRRSHCNPSSINARSRRGSSGAIASRTASPPAACTCAASEYEFEFRIWAGPGVASISTISSPVERIATRGLRKTCTRLWPTEAAIAILRDPVAAPDRAAVLPRALPHHAEQILARAHAALNLHALVAHPDVASFPTLGWDRSATIVCSTITTASAPGGNAAPVMIETACP